MVMNSTSLAEGSATSAGHELDGVWRNQFGSELRLEVDGAGGLKGAYRTAHAVLTGHSNAVVGSYNPAPSNAGSVLGFVVVWDELRSLTAWSGQYHPGADLIRATWLMTNETLEDEDWRSTIVGQDVFRRVGEGGDHGH
jgi:hypothetical protein